MSRLAGIIMLLLAISTMSMPQAGVVSFLAARYAADAGLLALLIGVPFAVCGALYYVPRAKAFRLWLIMPIPIYALMAAWIAITGTGNFTPAIMYVTVYLALIERIQEAD